MANPVIHLLIHGKHDGTKFESVPHSIRKLQYVRFRKCLWFIFPILNVQMDLSVAATLWGCNFKSA